MAGPHGFGYFERHLVDLTDGDPDTLAALADALEYGLEAEDSEEEPPITATCPRCGRGVDADEEALMEFSLVSASERICAHCADDEARDAGLQLRQLPRSAWPLRNPGPSRPPA